MDFALTCHSKHLSINLHLCDLWKKAIFDLSSALLLVCHSFRMKYEQECEISDLKFHRSTEVYCHVKIMSNKLSLIHAIWYSAIDDPCLQTMYKNPAFPYNYFVVFFWSFYPSSHHSRSKIINTSHSSTCMFRINKHHK